MAQVTYNPPDLHLLCHYLVSIKLSYALGLVSDGVRDKIGSLYLLDEAAVLPTA